MTWRDRQGSFIDLRDGSGRIRLYPPMTSRKPTPSSDADTGDIIGVEGMASNPPRISVHALAEAAVKTDTTADKFHADPRYRYRQRYVDLIINPEVKDTFIKQQDISYPEFLDARGYIEVDGSHTLLARPPALYHPPQHLIWICICGLKPSFI